MAFIRTAFWRTLWRVAQVMPLGLLGLLTLLAAGAFSPAQAHTPEEKSFYLQSRIVLQLNPNDARAGSAVGIWHLEYNKQALSLAAFRKVLKQHPGNPLAGAGLALLHEARGDLDAALHYAQGVALDKVPPNLRFFLGMVKGRLLFRQNKINEAKALFKAAQARLALQGDVINTHDLYYWQGQVLEREENWQQAEQAYLAAVNADPHWPGPYARLSLIYQRMGQQDKARAILAKLVDLDNPSPYPNNDVGLMWRWVMRGE